MLYDKLNSLDETTLESYQLLAAMNEIHTSKIGVGQTACDDIYRALVDQGYAAVQSKGLIFKSHTYEVTPKGWDVLQKEKHQYDGLVAKLKEAKPEDHVKVIEKAGTNPEDLTVKALVFSKKVDSKTFKNKNIGDTVKSVTTTTKDTYHSPYVYDSGIGMDDLLFYALITDGFSYQEPGYYPEPESHYQPEPEFRPEEPTVELEEPIRQTFVDDTPAFDGGSDSGSGCSSCGGGD